MSGAILKCGGVTLSSKCTDQHVKMYLINIYSDRDNNYVSAKRGTKIFTCA